MTGGLHDGHRRRLVNKVLNTDMEEWNEHELLELILFSIIPRANTNHIAHRLLDEFGTLHNVCGASESNLLKIDGVGQKTADFLKILPRFVRAYELSVYRGKNSYSDTDFLGIYCTKLFTCETSEKMYALFLNSRYELIKRKLLSVGTLNSVAINSKDLIRESINTNSAFLILCHNHPNGVLYPSQNDISLTNRFSSLLESVNVRLYDHIIVAGTEFFSFRREKIKVFSGK